MRSRCLIQGAARALGSIRCPRSPPSSSSLMPACRRRPGPRTAANSIQTPASSSSRSGSMARSGSTMPRCCAAAMLPERSTSEICAGRPSISRKATSTVASSIFRCSKDRLDRACCPSPKSCSRASRATRPRSSATTPNGRPTATPISARRAASVLKPRTPRLPPSSKTSRLPAGTCSRCRAMRASISASMAKASRRFSKLT